MTDAGLARLVDLDLLISSLRGEADLADRPGQYDRLNAAADVVVDALEYIRRLTAERDALAAQLDALRAECEDQRGARKVAADAADRFRDVLAECLGHDDNNPGDDALVAEVRARFGKTGPEPTRWRDFLTGALARVDQINAMPDPRALLGDDEREGGRS